MECGRRCVSYEGCISYNYEHKVNHTKGRTCELNSQTKESKPQAFKKKDGFQYYGSLHERKVFDKLIIFSSSFILSLYTKIALYFYKKYHHHWF